LILTLVYSYYWLFKSCNDVPADTCKCAIDNKPVEEPKKEEVVIIKEEPIIAHPVIATPPLRPTYPIREYIQYYDRKQLLDPLQSPDMRPDIEMLYGLEYQRLFNHYHTRGLPDSYRWMGLLICTDNNVTKNRLIKLFGRQKYAHGNDYEYYTMIHEDHDEIKINIHNKKHELYDDDEIIIPELGYQKYKVKLNRIEDSQYI
jgi:hypothetical protein